MLVSPLSYVSPAPAQASRQDAYTCSVVIPFFNEEVGTPGFLEELASAVEGVLGPVEVLLIDDGSTDGTAAKLEEAAECRPGWQVIRLVRNQGQAAALYRGMHSSSAPVIATLDGDGQNNPADLSLMLQTLISSGADMVAGKRARRQDSQLRRWMSRFANSVRGRLLQDGVSDTGCGLKVFHRRVLESFLPIRTLYSFMPALAVAAGFQVTEQTVEHRSRKSDQSKYGLGVMLWRPLVDLLGVWWFTARRFEAQTLPKAEIRG